MIYWHLTYNGLFCTSVYNTKNKGLTVLEDRKNLTIICDLIKRNKVKPKIRNFE